MKKKEQYKIGYKVVDSDYGSTWITNRATKLYYKSKSWITPKAKGTPIFLFDTFKSASRYAHQDQKILKVKYIPHPVRLNGITCFVPETVKSLEKYWEKYKCSWRNEPYGTVLAKAVYVIEEVSNPN